MRFFSLAGLFIGISIMLFLFLWHGIIDIFQLLLSSGWGLLWLPVAWSPSLAVATAAWRPLFPPDRTPPFLQLLRASWMGRAINTLLPVATIGGELAKARLITLAGARGVDAGAAVIVDKTVQALAIVPWGIAGSLLLLHIVGDRQLAVAVVAGVVLLSFGVAGFILVQRSGAAGFLASFAARFILEEKREGIVVNARELDLAIIDLYRAKGRFALSTLWQTLSLVLETAEVWLGCYLLGHSIGLPEALLLKSLISTLNNVAFFIPNGYGIQEGGYVMIGTLIGLPPGFALALSLATRIREMIIDLPGLIAWQYVEGRRLFAAR